VNRIVERTGAKIVISSTWRVTDGMERVSVVLRAHGFAGEIIGGTPVTSGTRGGEIKAWLDESSGVTSFVALDDATDMDPVRKRHVATSMEHGLLDVHVEEACTILARRRFWRWF
jgi:hypothetical protein